MPRLTAPGLAAALLVATFVPTSASAQSTKCDNPDWKLTAAEERINETQVAAAKENLVAAVQAWGCSERATTDQIARFYLLRAYANVLASAIGEKDGIKKSEFFVAARQADGDVWLDALGAVEKAVWQNAKPAGSAELKLVGVPENWTVLLNGRELARMKASDDPIEVRSGPHIIQLLDETGKPRWATYREDLPAGETLTFTPPADVIPDALRDAFMKQYGEGGIVVSGGVKGIGWKVGGPVTMAVGAGAIATTFALARDTPKRTGAGTALTVGNTAGWVVAAGGAAILTVGLLKQKNVSVGIGPNHLRIGGRF